MTKQINPAVLAVPHPVAGIFDRAQTQNIALSTSGSARDLVTPYFSIPVATKVDLLAKDCIENLAPSEGIDQFFSSLFYGISKTCDGIDHFFSFLFYGVSKTFKTWRYPSNSYDSSFIVAPRKLQVSHLPSPEFYSTLPPRQFLFSSSQIDPDLYTEPCLMKESVAEYPMVVQNEMHTLTLANETLPCCGVLKKDSSGRIYLAIESEKSTLEALIQSALGKKHVPKEIYMAPHDELQCTVFLPNEVLGAMNLRIMDELGSELPVTTTGCYSVATSSHPDYEKAWYLSLDSKDLEDLREKYLLSSKVAGHGFFATLVLKKREFPLRLEPQTFRLNVSCYAA